MQAAAHLALLAGAVALLLSNRQRWGSPLLPGGDWIPAAGTDPVRSLLRLLVTAVGGPALALAATAPLVQAWLARERPASPPYRLYAWSNFGSLLGLGGFVFAAEPLLPLSRQAAFWSLLFGIEALAIAGLARRTAAKAGAVTSLPARDQAWEAPTVRQRLLWLALPAAGSAALLAVTNQICQELTVLPLLWVLPLALYLATYMLAFAGPRWRLRRVTAPLLLAGLACAAIVLYYQLDLPVLLQIGAFSFSLFAVGLACHGELARLQPPARHLTAYYLTGAAGGALGGFFVAAAAPLLFRGLWELHVALLAAALVFALALAEDRDSSLRRGEVAPALATLGASGALAAALVGAAIASAAAAQGERGGSRERLLILGGTAAIVLYLFWRVRRRDALPRFVSSLAIGLSLALFAWTLRTHAAALAAGARFAARDFFAAVQVREVAADDPEERAYWLFHGRIVHGFQYTLPEYRALPTSYYGAESGLALAIARHPKRRMDPPRPLRIGVLGLGIGTVATHTLPGDHVRFYEISPTVIRLAQGEGGFFTYLRDARGTIAVVPGDARVTLEHELRTGGEPPCDVLVLDAFASGAVPVHLLTREAFRVYLAHLAPDGLLVINVSNRTLDLSSVVWRLAAEERLAGVSIESPASLDGANWHSLWILLGRDRALLDDPEIAARATAAPARSSDAPLWTDEHSSLVGLLRPAAW